MAISDPTTTVRPVGYGPVRNDIAFAAKVTSITRNINGLPMGILTLAKVYFSYRRTGFCVGLNQHEILIQSKN